VAREDKENDVDDRNDTKKLIDNFFGTLRMARGCLSSDPRDKLYDILPLLHSLDVDGLLRPDCGLSSERVFTNSAINLCQEKGLEVLKEGCTILNLGSVKGLQFWTPDCTHTEKDRPILAVSTEFLLHGQRNAGTLVESAKPRCTFPVEGQSVRQLQVRGIWIEPVVQTSGECIVKTSIIPLSQWRKSAHSAAKLTTRFHKTEASDFALLFTHGNILLLVYFEESSSSLPHG
jgi:hypothetical protein